MKTSLKITNKNKIAELEVLKEILNPGDDDITCKYLYKKDGSLQATDKRQLAIINGLDETLQGFEELEDGHYELIKKNAKTYYLINAEIDSAHSHFPETSDIFSKDYSSFMLFSFTNQEKEDVFAKSVCELIELSKTHFNFEFVKKLKKLNSTLTVDYDKYERNPLRFKSGDFVYMLMPIVKPEYLQQRDLEQRNMEAAA